MELKTHCKFDKNLKIEDLKLLFNPENPNTHPEDQIQALAEVLEYQGVRREAVISNRSGKITQGHGRIMAAERLGAEHFPVTFQDYDNEEMEYADMVADNALNQRSILDYKLIDKITQKIDPKFEFKLLGLKDFCVDITSKIDASFVDKTKEEAEKYLESNNEPDKVGRLWLSVIFPDGELELYERIKAILCTGKSREMDYKLLELLCTNYEKNNSDIKE